MRTVRRDPNITEEVRAARRALMEERGAAMRTRAAHADAAYRLATAFAASLSSVGPPSSVEEFEAEMDRRDALAATGRAPDRD